MKSFLSNKKGSSMVEAAIVFPFIILVVLVVITITIWLYEEEVSLVALHLNLWDQAQLEAETGKDKKDFDMYAPEDPYGKEKFYFEKKEKKSFGLPFMKIKAYISETHERAGFFPYSSKVDLHSQIYIINETDYIRCYDSMISGE